MRICGCELRLTISIRDTLTLTTIPTSTLHSTVKINVSVIMNRSVHADMRQKYAISCGDSARIEFTTRPMLQDTREM